MSLLAILIVTASSAGAFLWLNSRPADSNQANDLPVNTSQQIKAPEPNTVVYGFKGDTLPGPGGLFWRPAVGGEGQATTSKVYVGSTLIHGNQVLVESVGVDKKAPAILHSSDGGKTYTAIFTGKPAATANELGDQITGMTFASDGKSVVFGLLPDGAKNTVKQVFFDKPNVTTDLMSTTARGVFPIAFNAKTKRLVFSEGCYNCDGNGASTSAIAYDVASQTRTILIDGTDKHLGIIANESATRLLVTTPTVDQKRTGGIDGGFWGYYIGAPYTLTIFDIETGKNIEPALAIDDTLEKDYVRGGFMADDQTPYYFSGNKVFMPGKDEPTLLYEAGQPILDAFYVSRDIIFASTGTYNGFTLNRFEAKSQNTEQILTGDGNSTRIFGVTEN